MLPISKTEEIISLSYVSAVIARSGNTPTTPTHDFGVDMSVTRIGKFGNKVISLGAIFDFQLKASINWIEQGDVIAFDLDADAYNRLVLRRMNATIPCFLVVCCLPKEEEHWLSVSELEFVIRKCCYYYFPDGELTDNNSSKRIKIPRTQVLTPQAILHLQRQVLGGAFK